jgi:hypothetical protein
MPTPRQNNRVWELTGAAPVWPAALEDYTHVRVDATGLTLASSLTLPDPSDTSFAAELMVTCHSGIAMLDGIPIYGNYVRRFIWKVGSNIWVSLDVTEVVSYHPDSPPGLTISQDYLTSYGEKVTIVVNQTTAGQSMTLGNPVVSTYTLTLVNKGTASMNVPAVVGGATLRAGQMLNLRYYSTHGGWYKEDLPFAGTDGFTAGAQGAVPAPATADAGKFLKSDGTWASTGFVYKEINGSAFLPSAELIGPNDDIFVNVVSLAGAIILGAGLVPLNSRARVTHASGPLSTDPANPSIVISDVDGADFGIDVPGSSVELIRLATGWKIVGY